MLLGRTGSPWDFVPVGLAAMRVMPGDEEVRFLLAAAYARVGLRTAAGEQIALMSAGARGSAGVRELERVVARLADDRVSVGALQEDLLKNVDALRGRAMGAIDLRGEVEAWRARAAEREHFRAASGDIVWRSVGERGGWMRLTNQAEQARGVRLPHDERSTAATPPPWYIVEGIDPPWILRRVAAATSGRLDGYSARVIVVQAETRQFVDGLAQADMAGVLAEERVMALVGDDAGARLEAFVNERAARGVRVASVAIGLPTTVRRIAPSPQEMVNRATAMAQQAAAETRRAVDAAYAVRDRAWLAARIGRAMKGTDAPLRVLVVTSRFSTFLRHSAADLAAGLEEAGCAVRVVMEPDDHSLTDPLQRLLAIKEFEPDVAVVPNYLRNDLRESLPQHLALVTWIQDAMPHLYDASAGASLGPMDFVVGNLAEDLFQKFSYPRGRSLAMPMAASSVKFHRGEVEAGMAVRHACEIAYVSHHSETPEAMLRRKSEEAGNAGEVVAAMGALYERVREIVERPITAGPLATALRAASVEELGRAGARADDRAVAATMTTLTMPLADRMLRHRTLEWAAGIARERGWRMHLYGRGWNAHPTLGALACGELEHGEDLRACYQTARVHLHVSLHTAIHQRVFECALSGGLPVCRLMADDLSHLEYLAAAHACRAGEAAVSDPWRTAGKTWRFLGYRPGACAAGSRYARLVEEVGLSEPEFVWLNEIHAQRLRGSAEEAIDGDGRSLWDLWPDPGAVMFHDADSMRRVLTRAIEDRAWRDGASAAMAARARETVTYGAFARSMLGLVARGLAAGPSDGERWYDARARGARGAGGA